MLVNKVFKISTVTLLRVKLARTITSSSISAEGVSSGTATGVAADCVSAVVCTVMSAQCTLIII